MAFVMAVSSQIGGDASDWRDLALAAATLDERLAGAPAATTLSEEQRRQAEQRRSRWCHSAARGDAEAFARRLDWLGVSPGKLTAALADGASTPAARDQTWLDLLQEAAAVARVFEPTALARLPIDPARPLPFEDVLLPIVVVARRRLAAALAPPLLCRVGAPAALALERQLLEGIVELAEDCLMEMFERWRPSGVGLLERFVRTPETGASRGHYAALVERLWCSGLLEVWQAYPALARMVATRALLWHDATLELLEHLEHDLPALERTFGGGDATSPDHVATPLGCVVGLEPGRSDPHRGFRSVVFLTFASGVRLVYKPRSLALEGAYARWLDWLERQGAPIALRAPLSVDGGAGASAHGWMEWIERRPCLGPEGAGRFYERAGAHLCLLYLLGACDLHHDNLIACGEHPMLVDLETLLQPEGGLRLSPGSEDGASHLQRRFWSSVLSTGFLPRWDLGPDGRTAFDLSALGGLGAQRTGWRSRDWRAINTDVMYCVRTPSVVEEGAGAPSVGGLPARPEEHLDALCSGFERTYRFLRTVRADLDREGGPLAGLAACRTRVLLRATGVYYGVLDRALEPAALRSGVLRAIELDALARALLLGEPVLGGGAILDAEREALWRGDVPTFWVQCDRRELRSEADRDLDGRYSVSGLAAVRQRLDGMSEQDLEEQLELIRGAVHARLALPSDRAAGGGAPLPGPRPGRRQRSASFEHVALRCARAIAARLEESALRSPEGAGWIGLVFLAGARRYQLVPLGPSLYDGNAGIALFLSALAAVDRDDAMAAFARAALSPLCHPTRDGSALGIGGLAGLGSVVYAQSRVALLLDDPSLLHDAQRSAAAITEGAIAGDRELDLVSGVAGAMLGLLALAETSADEMVRRDTLERARLCGEHLLARHLSCEGRPPAWLGDGEDVPLTGFSHGAAGIAYSLARLYGVSGGPALREAALGGIRYERETFDAEAGNWPDLRRDASGAKRGFGCSWCHGAPGIGLARLGTLGALTNGDSGANGNGGADGETTARERRELCEEIEVALRSICSTDLIDVDTVCCGNFGRLETLLVASLRLSRPHLLEEARAQARAALERAEGEGGFRLFANLPRQVSSPGFFQGIAGIGYQLLRLAFPERLPSVLSLE